MRRGVLGAVAGLLAGVFFSGCAFQQPGHNFPVVDVATATGPVTDLRVNALPFELVPGWVAGTPLLGLTTLPDLDGIAPNLLSVGRVYLGGRAELLPRPPAEGQSRPEPRPWGVVPYLTLARRPTLRIPTGETRTELDEFGNPVTVEITRGESGEWAFALPGVEAFWRVAEAVSLHLEGDVEGTGGSGSYLLRTGVAFGGPAAPALVSVVAEQRAWEFTVGASGARDHARGVQRALYAAYTLRLALLYVSAGAGYQAVAREVRLGLSDTRHEDGEGLFLRLQFGVGAKAW